MVTRPAYAVVIGFGALLLLAAWYDSAPEPKSSAAATVLASNSGTTTPPPPQALATLKPAASAPQAATSDSANNANHNSDSKPKIRLTRLVNWTTHPGNLYDMVLRAFANQDGELAADSAELLSLCEFLADLLSASPKIKISGDSAIVSAELLTMRRDYARCQTVPGDQNALRERLLELAYQRHVPGAARELIYLGNKDPHIAARVIDDAIAGDFNSLMSVLRAQAQTLPLKADTQTMLRYTLQLVANDAEMAELIRPQLHQTELLSYTLGEIKTQQFDSSGLSEASKAQASLIAARLIARAKSLAN